jgi:hypothetical protein
MKLDDAQLRGGFLGCFACAISSISVSRARFAARFFPTALVPVSLTRGFDLLPILRRKLDLRGGHVFFQMGDVGCSQDKQHHRTN